MKKTFLAFLLFGGCATLFAQDTTMNNTGQNANTATTSSYNAYGTTSVTAPASIQSSFNRDYPNAQNATWQQMGDQWRASYNNAGRMTNVYYTQNGASYSVSLPVLNTYVPEELVNKAVIMHGGNLYSLTMLKGAEGQNVLGVTVLDNGASRIEFVGEDGAVVTNVFRVDTGTTMGVNAGMNTQSNMNANGTTTIYTPNNNVNSDTMMNRNANMDTMMMNRNRNGDIMNNNGNRMDSTMRRDTMNGSWNNNMPMNNGTNNPDSTKIRNATDSAIINRRDTTSGTGNGTYPNRNGTNGGSALNAADRNNTNTNGNTPAQTDTPNNSATLPKEGDK